MADQEKEDPSKEDIIRAKQAISPAGLGNRSGADLPGSELPDEDIQELPADELEDKYMTGDDLGENVREMNPNRNRDGKADLDKPAYGGGH
ncbi:hypothetical protein GCM10023189_49770 [Nibrella saemangeumensis]|uniref:Uncharacterized protein n=1 Tax=Nibrella saemangeumensis TaxID=1084526 RepID=A0ABP8NK95_9BACT